MDDSQSFSASVLGCKVNFADAEALTALLPARLPSPARIVATCCVTAEGEKQSRKEVRRAARQVGSRGTVFVTGCAARLDPVGFARLAGNVKVLPSDPVDAAAMITDEYPVAVDDAAATPERVRTRYFLKAQDGCSSRCSYCVVPLVRGEPRSLPCDQLIALAREQVARGYPEIVVSGINLGAYRDGEVELPGLLEELAATRGLARLRLSSIEALGLTPELLAVIGASDRIARHLHVPLQSGDDRVLGDMRRRYSLDQFSERAAAARAAISGVSLTTDIMVGFPSEDEAAFRSTLAALESIGFSRAHVFTFSPRPGTAAAGMGDPVAPAVKKARSQAARELSRRLQLEHQRRKLGGVSEVLLESPAADGSIGGYSSDYTRFQVRGGAPGSIIRVVAEAIEDGRLSGKVVQDEQT